jgi:ornithine cyclodeaminase
MLFLKQQEVEALLDLDQLVQALAPAMADLSTGRVSLPPRVGALIPEQGGLLGVMPVYLNSSQTLAAKLVSVFPHNASAGLPSHQAVVLVFDAATGAPLALMDGTYLTAVRTAAGSALATQLLARPEADVLTIVGTGAQAKTHARAIPRVRPVKEIRIFGRNQEKASRLAEEIAIELGLPVQPVSPFREAAAGAGIICATTHAAEPVVMGKWLEPGVHVNSVGLNPEGRELDNETIAKSRIVVESRSAALTHLPGGANDLLWPIRDGLITEKDIQAEVGELVAGTREGRTSPEQITLYKSVGVAVQDAVSAQLILEAARAQRVGLEIEI